MKVYVKFIDVGKKIKDTSFYPEQVMKEIGVAKLISDKMKFVERYCQR